MLLSLVLFLVVAGVVLYLITLIPMDPTIVQVIRVVVILVLVLAVIDTIFNLGWGFGNLSFRRR